MSLILFVVRSPVLVLLFKSTLLFSFGWVIHWLLRRRHPRLRMLLWRTILCFSLVLPLAQFSPFTILNIPVRNPALTSFVPSDEPQPSPAGQPKQPLSTTATGFDPLPAHNPKQVVSPPPRLVRHPVEWKTILFSAWALGAVLGLLRLSRLQIQLSRLRTNAGFPKPALHDLTQKLRSDLGITRPVELRIGSQFGSPFICGLARPTILLPTSIAHELSAAELTALLSHEIAHLRHHDLLWCLGWQFMKIPFWFHPLVWGIPAAHNFACEEEADRIASGQSQNVTVYAQSLASLTMRVLSLRPVETELSLNAASQISRRLSRLKQGAAGHWNWKHSWGVSVLAVTLGLVAVAPRFSQADAKSAAGTNSLGASPATNTLSAGRSLTVQRGPTITGKVIDKETRQPIATFQVHPVRILQGPVIPSLSPREILTGNAGLFKYSFVDFFWPDSAFYIDAEGYLPVLSRPLTRADDGTELNFELSRSLPVKGEVLSPQGAPAEKAEIRLWCGELNIQDIPRNHETESDHQGTFTVPPILDGKVLVYHNSGYAEVPWKEFTANGRIQLSKWGHVRGHWPKPLSHKRISIERINRSGRMNSYAYLPPWKVSSTAVDSDGNFEFADGAPPGEYMLTEWNDLQITYARGERRSRVVLMSMRAHVLVQPGQTSVLEVPAGRTVVGKYAAGDEHSLTNVHLPIVSLRLKQNGLDLKFPGLDRSLSETETFNRWKQYREQTLEFCLSPQGKALARAERVYEIPTEPDGTFRLDNVPAGTYELQINAQRWAGKAGPEIRRDVIIAESADRTPLDLGPLK